ncbi:hypothetical protein CONLIGDRAFT_665807 [Coniochaeta ligniaria NRRL 30616]|uniref:C2H2-type domain-containing protein n=1 Tax=Coniochaeta ligniaria NRRL 30616 TaxID=1408157 RepID=A0A1J7J4V6_9PEZI|nr:hypothetical protein CONLIGDRAFT_665807 [Coniochaeta ligniaria NRRL 30616]
MGGQEVSSSQQAFFDGMFGMVPFKPFDIVKHIGVAHNDPVSSNCMRPCPIDNPQVFQYFQHCPLPNSNSFDFQVDSYSDIDNNPFLMNSFNDDGSINFLAHNHLEFEGCGADISNPEALVEHFNTQHRHMFENVLAHGDAYGGSALPQMPPRTLSSSSSNTLEPSLSSTTHSPQVPFPPTPLSLCHEVSQPSKQSGHHSRSSTVSQVGTCNEYEQQCFWCSSETGERCGQIFQDSEALFAHVNAEHIQKLEKGAHGFMCHWENCKRRGDGKEGFPQRSKIERHMHTHIGRKPFECKSCGQRFSAQQALTQHMLIHSDEKPLRCDWEGCGKTFRQQSALTMHRRIHTGDKPLKCPVCGKAFSESSNLSKHKRIHETKGRFSCQEPGCSRSFHRLDQLRRHMKLHPAAEKKMKEEMISGIDDLMSVMPSPLEAGEELGEPTRKKRSR